MNCRSQPFLVGFIHVLYKFVHSPCFVAFYCMNMPQLIYILLLMSIYVFPVFFVTGNSAAVKIFIHVFFINSCIHFHWVYTKEVDLLGICMLSFSRSCQRSYTHSHAHQPSLRALLTSHTCQL